MRFFSIFLMVILIAGCKKETKVAFSGNITGLKNGVFTIKTTSDSTIFGENIKDGKFSIPPHRLMHPGYYKLNITSADQSDDHSPFEVYLEDGNYTIEAKATELYKYPKIISTSEKQQQLSDFYTLSDSLGATAHQEVKRIKAKMDKDYSSLSREEYNSLMAKFQENMDKLNNLDAVVLKRFLKKYPNSEISAHLLAKINYEDDPENYYAIFKQLAPAAQQSEDGQEVGENLANLMKTATGKKIPAPEGNTPDGRPFDAASIHKKLIVIDFWKAANELSRTNHDQIKSLLAQPEVGKNVAFISVSLDSKEDWWQTALHDDHLNWIQVSDLKGNDSPNASNYNITEIPTYFIVDGNWKVVVPRVPLKNIGFEITDYLKKHPN
ncbi:MAG TPA: thioredoxin family protein [Mucilaginibacter sp.]|nr:thioredoxin family protein [Mucilaginibacter sp.]